MSTSPYCLAGNPQGLTMEFDGRLEQCPLCDSTELASYDVDYEGRCVDRCRSCRLLFMNPQYTDDYLSQYYSSYGQCGDNELVIPDPNDLTQRRVAAKADALSLVRDHCQPGRLLSIGCYDGVELLLAEQRGWKPEGYDVDDATMQLLRRQVDYPIYSGDFFELGLAAEQYDCIYMDQVLEHPKNPQDYLREAHRLLRPGGVLYIGCPNIASVSNRLKTALGKLHLKRRRGKQYDMFHHLFFYDPKTLTRILESRYDFEVVAAQGDPVIGLKSMDVADTWRARLNNQLRRDFPILESSFRLLARKPPARNASLAKAA